MKGILMYEGVTEQQKEDAMTVNVILDVLRRSNNRVPGALLYLGHKQRYAILSHEGFYKHYQMDQGSGTFEGWEVVWVMKESHIHLAAY